MNKISITISPEILSNTVVGVCEAGYSQWLASFALSCRVNEEYSHNDNWDITKNPGLQVNVVYDDPEHAEGTFKGTKNIGWPHIKKGLELMAEKNPHQFSLLIGGNDDAITHDVLWQFIILESEVYG